MFIALEVGDGEILIPIKYIDGISYEAETDIVTMNINNRELKPKTSYDDIKSQLRALKLLEIQ